MKIPYKLPIVPDLLTIKSPAHAVINRLGLFILLLLGLVPGASGQRRSDQNFFSPAAEGRGAASPLAVALFHSRALTLDVDGLRTALALAPSALPAGAAARSGAPLTLLLPLPDGRVGRFALREAPVMEPALAARFPGIKTYAGIGLDDALASVRLDLTPQGFHAQVLTGAGQSFYIDPVSRADSRHYLSYYKRDMNRGAVGSTLVCGFKPTAADRKITAVRLASAAYAGGLARALVSGSQLRTYRLALACTPEYALVKGNTVASVLAAEVTTVNRVVGVYEKELAVAMVLVANNDQLVFLSGTGPQPSPTYTNNNGSALLDQNQANVDRIIGTANYDIGHVVSTGGGGVAYLGVVCDSGQKAGGVTGSPTPVGDAFDIDYVAHEMGHQFGGTHPFNGDADNCAGANRNPLTAWEPGSGSTIMAYAGICGTSNDLQANSDPTFHTGNYVQMRAFIDGTTCGTTLPTGNTAPVVTAPASGKTLPVGTPFKLTATATDAQNDALTYSWEELDLGPTGTPTTVQLTNQNVPLFRSFNPAVSGTRYFPRLSNLITNTSAIGERLPTVTRTLKFRCTARDEHSGPAGVVGGVNFSALVNLSVSSTAGPFIVTAPTTAVTWTGGAAQLVTWNVANTAAAPVSCALVNLRLSLDGGLTYPTVLALNQLNTGSAIVVAPSPTTTQTQARVLVEAADNYFFDISNVNFTITPPATGPTISGFTPPGGLPGTVVTVLGSNFTGATAVTFNGQPAAAFTVNSATQLTATVPVGASTGPIAVAAASGTATSVRSFVVGAPPVVTGFTPATGPVGTSVLITGSAFTSASQVTFNGTAALVFTVNSATQITATVPAGAITGPIAVTTPVNTAVSATSFVVIPPPAITSFTPAIGPPGTVVVLTGTNFTGTTRVSFNGTNAPAFTVNSDTKLTVTVPAGASTGAIIVTATGGTGSSDANYQVPPVNDLCANALPLACGQTLTGTTVSATATGDPTATCTEPIDAGGVFYTITGTGTNLTVSTCNAGTTFDTKLFVFSGACESYTCVAGNDDDPNCGVNTGASTVTFKSVAGATYRIFVTGFQTDTGTFSLSASCTAAPVATSLSPASGPVGAHVTLTGTNLTSASSLTLNGVAIPGYTVVNATTIVFTVPVGASTGSVVVTTVGGSSNALAFTVTVATATASTTRSEFSVWPNPLAANGVLHVSLAVPATTAILTLHSVLGQLVRIKSFSGSTTELTTTGLAAGTYLLTVQLDDHSPSIRRVVVE